MLIRHADSILPFEITPPEIYRGRRRFMQGMGALAAGAILAAAPDGEAGVKLRGVRASAYRLDDTRTPYEDVTTYTNFYDWAPARTTRRGTRAV